MNSDADRQTVIPLSLSVLQLLQLSNADKAVVGVGAGTPERSDLPAQSMAPVVWVLAADGTGGMQLTGMSAENTAMLCETPRELEAGSSGDFRSDTTDVQMPDTIVMKKEPVMAPISITSSGIGKFEGAASPTLTSSASPVVSSCRAEQGAGITVMDLSDGTPSGKPLLKALSSGLPDYDAVNPSTLCSEERRKARNRRAQRKFRERQRLRIAALENEVQTLHNKLHEMQMENAKLRRENHIVKAYMPTVKEIKN